jgi:hypothetical protein
MLRKGLVETENLTTEDEKVLDQYGFFLDDDQIKNYSDQYQ